MVPLQASLGGGKAGEGEQQESEPGQELAGAEQGGQPRVRCVPCYCQLRVRCNRALIEKHQSPTKTLQLTSEEPGGEPGYDVALAIASCEDTMGWTKSN